MALSLRRLSTQLKLPHQASCSQKRSVSILNKRSCAPLRPRFSYFQQRIQLKSLRQYCTFKDLGETREQILVEESEIIEEEALEDEIPLVESHWESYENELRKRLVDRLQATYVEILDKTRPNCGIVLEIHVESSKFATLNKIEATRLVTSSLQGLVDDVHAMTIKTRIPS